MLLDSILKGLELGRPPRRANRGQRERRPRFETFEERRMLSFTLAASYTVGTDPQAVVAADFNNDGRDDVAVANAGSDNMSVFLANADGTLQPTGTFAAGDNPVSLAVGDFNADGTLDLAGPSGSGSGVKVMFGNADGTFRAPNHIAVGYPTVESVAAGDFNRDGKTDLVVTSNYRPADWYPQGQVDVLLSIGDGSFAEPRTYLWFWERAVGKAVVADMNGDDNPDLVTEMPDYSRIIVLLGDGGGNFNHPSSGSAQATTPSAAGDLNSDDKVDVITGDGQLFGNGTGGFLSKFRTVGGNGPGSVAPGDFDHDGSLDVAAPYGIQRNAGDGIFFSVENFDFGSGDSEAAGDFNDDGVVDSADYVVWRKTSGAADEYDAWNEAFGQSLGSVDPVPVAVAAGDFNGDGWLDVATANANGSVSVMLNDQSWAPVPPTIFVSDATAVTEGNTGTVNAVFTLTLSKAAAVDVTVQYATADGSALAGSDYTAASGTVTIPAGETSTTFTIVILGDRIAEPTETFAVNISAPSNATIRDGQGIGTIVDNEPRISINDVNKQEGKGNKTTLFTFTITLSAAYDQPVTMSYQTVNGTGTTADNDYMAKTGMLTFAPGETTKTITIEVKADSKKEADETFYVDLFDSSINSLFNKYRGIGTILNDD